MAKVGEKKRVRRRGTASLYLPLEGYVEFPEPSDSTFDIGTVATGRAPDEGARRGYTSSEQFVS